MSEDLQQTIEHLRSLVKSQQEKLDACAWLLKSTLAIMSAVGIETKTEQQIKRFKEEYEKEINPFNNNSTGKL